MTAERPRVLEKTAPETPRPVPKAPTREALKAQKELYDKSDLDGTDSRYLCLFCYEPLYINAATDAMGEMCLNPRCTCRAWTGAITGDIAEHDGPRRVERDFKASVRGLHRFSQKFLLQNIHDARGAECASLLRNDGMRIDILASLDYLLTQLSGSSTWGDSCDYHDCSGALETYYKSFEMRQFVEDVRSKIYITNARGQAFVAKYYFAIKEFLRAYGIVGDDDRRSRADPLPFYHIDRRSMGAPAESALDFESIYKNSMPIAMSLNYVFKMHHSISKIHGYPARPEDLAALRYLWGTCLPGSAGAVTVDGLRDIYEVAVRNNGMDGNFDLFLEDYASGKTYAPILIFDGEKYHYDYPTLLLYLIYLYSNNTSQTGTQDEAGRTTYDKNRQSAAQYFEAKIRQKLRDEGFDVRPQQGGKPFRPSFDGERREFDCVAVDREHKIVIILEAKYEDMAPSSMAADTMVDQLVLDKKRGLLGHAKKHHSRREFFKRHFRDMKQHGLDLPGHFLDYTVHTLLVTKHEPLISRHMSVDILSYREFMSIDFRSPPAQPDGDREEGSPARPSPGRGGGTARPAEPPALGGAEEERRQGYVDWGDRLFGEGRYSEAYKNYRLAANMRAPDAGLHLKMAQSMSEMKLYKGALRHCRAAIRAEPARADAYVGAAHCLDRLGKHVKALPYSRQAVRRDPSNARAHLLCGTILNKLGRHEKALFHYLRAAELDPGGVRAHQNASLSLFHLERYEEALQQAKTAAEILPADQVSHARIAICLSKLGRHEEAIPAGRRAIEAAPNSVDSYFPLVTALFELGRHKKVLEWCSLAAEADPVDPRPHFVMALSLRELSRQEEALAHCEKSVGLDPDNTYFRTAMYQLLRELGRFTEALPHCRAVVSARPDNLPALSNMGSMLAETGRHKAALTCLRKALRIDPNQPVPRYNRALILQITGRPRKALKEYRRVVKLDPDNTGAHNNMGIILAEQGRADEALAHFDRALVLDTGNAIVHQNKALSLQRLSRHSEALAHFDRALVLDPSSTDAHIGRATCLVELGLTDEAIGHYAEEMLGPAADAAGGTGPSTAGPAADALATAAPPSPSPEQSDSPASDRARRVESLLPEDESGVLAFLSWPASRPGAPSCSSEMGGKIAMELCSLANTDGGDLLIGGGYRLSRRDRKELLAWVSNVIVDYFRVEHGDLFDREIVEVDGRHVLHCAVAASRDGPVILKKHLEENHVFFKKEGNTCRALGLQEALDYIGKKWPKPAPHLQTIGQSEADRPRSGYYALARDMLASTIRVFIENATSMLGSI